MEGWTEQNMRVDCKTKTTVKDGVQLVRDGGFRVGNL